MFDSDTVDRAADARRTPAPAGSSRRPRRCCSGIRSTRSQSRRRGAADAFRQAVWLRDVEEFSYAEIAEMLAIPVGTVMSRILAGRRLLFESVDRGAARLDGEEHGSP
jgi:RNA polymerase sigma-70 factor (ECF subfamily)